MIKVENLYFKYSNGKTNALEDVSFTIQEGKHIGILGHNGSGKSTLSKLLVGLYKNTKGSISIDDIIIKKNTLRKIRSKVGIVFQNPDNQFIGASVEDDIAFGLENKLIDPKKMKKIIYDLAKKVGMLNYMDHEPEKLSGGQKQRVAIASALALNPEIIIFDEVTSMLDPKGKEEVLLLIKEIHANKSKTLISITHDMDEALMTDELIVLSEGKLVAQGKPEKILADEEIIKLAKIDNPFIYKLSKQLSSIGIKPTFEEKQLLEQLCK